MRCENNVFNIDLHVGQFAVYIINVYGQTLLFSGDPFLIGRSKNEEGMKIFTNYEDAISFAKELVLPVTAKTYCICDHNWKCIKSGTGDEEHEYNVRTRKLSSNKAQRNSLMQKIITIIQKRK